MSRVLVVEDELAIAELIALNLRHSGFEVVLARDGDEAQLEIDKVLPDLVLLDWMLPDLSGTVLARRLRADPLRSAQDAQPVVREDLPLLTIREERQRLDERRELHAQHRHDHHGIAGGHGVGRMAVRQDF